MVVVVWGLLDLRRPAPSVAWDDGLLVETGLAAAPRADVAFSPTSADPSGHGEPPALRLYGVRIDGARSTAILAGQDDRQVSVRLGEPTPGGGRLASISGDHIMVARGDGDLHRIEFTAPAETASGWRAGAAPQRTAAASSAMSSLSVARDGPRASGDAAPYVSGLRATPSGSSQKGFVWRPGARLDSLAKAGLRPGDTVVAINGMEFHDPERLQELADELAMGRSVALTYVRGGQRREATVSAQ